jgi:hypothetical protein
LFKWSIIYLKIAWLQLSYIQLIIFLINFVF